jgi:hypothetical protein
MTADETCPATAHPVWADGSQDHYTCRLPKGHEGYHVSREDDGAWTW